jgi:hypothetical protein
MQAGRGVDHPLPPSTEAKERVEAQILILLLNFAACSRVNYTFTFTTSINNDIQNRMNKVRNNNTFNIQMQYKRDTLREN